jgi:LEA14-like dessication related protein
VKAAVLALIVLLVLAFPVVLYGYGYVKTSEALNRVVESIEVSGFKVMDVSILPPSIELKVTLTIGNPTDTSIVLQSVYLEVFLEEFKLGEITVAGKPLPSGAVTTLEGLMRIEAGTALAAVRSYIERGNVTLRITGSVVASATYLFITVSREASVNLEKTYSMRKMLTEEVALSWECSRDFPYKFISDDALRCLML